MKLDMHCHTKEGSLDGKVSIGDYIAILQRRGFDGMVVTDHNSYNGYRYWKNHLKDRKYTDFKVFKGVEYDTIDAGHILIIMPEDVKLKILELRGLPVLALIELVHKHGGILGPAHPCGEKYLSLTNTKKYWFRKNILAKFDFIEEFNACESEESNRSAAMLAQVYRLSGIGGSDAHKVDCIGTAYTILKERVESESELIAYIKARKPMKTGGVYYHGTTKERLGIAHVVLTQSFWVYNHFTWLIKTYSRKKTFKTEGK